MKNKNKRVAVIHTSFVSVEDLKSIFKEIIPQVHMVNIVDDSLLPEVIESGGLTPSIVRRICSYAINAEEMGVDLILNQCSSVGEAVDVARAMLKIPYLKIDEPMAEEAVKIGGHITVVATLPTTLKPSVALIEKAAISAGKKVQINKCLVEGAFELLIEGKREQHNQMVLETIRKKQGSSDVIVLAQGSMICLLPQLSDISVPVLTSPRLGVENVKRRLGL
jgi:Asp/Glu/hydantoin racemase